MKCIVGKKIEMSQQFAPDGFVIPVTVIKAGPCSITGIRTKERDGYSAIQLSFEEVKKLRKSVLGQVKNLSLKPRFLKEFRVEAPENNIGDQVDVSMFIPGEKVMISGTSKGKGFQGVVKRYNFGGSPKTHGHKDQLRMPGSIGATDPQRVFKGTRMGGRMGHETITVRNLTVVAVDVEKNLLYVKGAVPGARGSLVKIVSV